MKFFGLEVVVDDQLCYQQKIKLSADAPVSDEFREEMNQWLRDRFGGEKRRYRIDNRLFVCYQDFIQLQTEARKHQSDTSPLN